MISIDYATRAQVIAETVQHEGANPHQAVRDLAGLLTEAASALHTHQTSALIRQAIPQPTRGPIIPATWDELESLRNTAIHTGYTATLAVSDRIAERIGEASSELLRRQLIAAGAAVLLEVLDEVLDAEDQDDETAADANTTDEGLDVHYQPIA